MNDLGLVGICIEGSVDRFCGRPREQNPYSFECAREWWEAWLYGWDEGDWFLGMRGQEEAARWLRGAA